MFRKLHDPGASAITVHIDGRPVAAQAGESIAAIMLRQSECWSRTTPVSRERRAPYCMMGVCFDCLVEIDGRGSVQGCLTPAADGMRITRQQGPRSLSA